MKTATFSYTKCKRSLPSNYPAEIRRTIGNTAPDSTPSTVQAKKSYFE